jgi:hypothetical protein
LKKRQRKKLLKQAREKRTVIHENSMVPRIYKHKRFYRKTDTPVLTASEQKVYAEFESYCIKETERILAELALEKS